MNIIELNHIDLNSIGLNSKVIEGVGKSHDGKIKPYIKGHITDGSSTFTFKVNNADVTVPVDANGNWKWVQDRDITSLNSCFNYQKKSCDYIEIYLPKTPNLTDMYRFLYATNGEVDQRKSDLKVVIKAIDTANVTNLEGAFKNSRQIDMDYLPLVRTENCTNFYNMVHSQYVKVVDLRSFDMSKSTGNLSNTGISNNIWNSTTETVYLGNFCSNPANNGCIPFYGTNPNLKNVTAETIKINLSLYGSPVLTEQSVVNLFNAVAADGITLTFHQNVWNMIMREIDVQSSPIQVAYQNMIDNYDVTIANASFDAEIEYLESSGTQYINTNAIVKNETIYDIKAQITQLQETAPLGGENFFIGTMSANNASYTLRCLVNGDNIIIQRGEFALNGVVFIPKDTNWHTYYNSKTLCKIDNTTGVPSYTITDNDLKIFLFKQNRDGSANKDSYCRIAYCKIWDGSTLVRDFIPVRKGTTGYMYDKVSGNLFGNSGTGDFILGNDK